MQEKSAVGETVIIIFLWILLLKHISFLKTSVLFLKLYRQINTIFGAAGFL